MRGYQKLDDIEYKVFNKGVSCKKLSVFERFPIGTRKSVFKTR